MGKGLDLNDADHYITTIDGAIHYESVFDKEFDGNLAVLLSCVEDNIYEAQGQEDIDWPAVREDYRESMKMPCNSHK